MSSISDFTELSVCGVRISIINTSAHPLLSQNFGQKKAEAMTMPHTNISLEPPWTNLGAKYVSRVVIYVASLRIESKQCVRNQNRWSNLMAAEF